MSRCLLLASSLADEALDRRCIRCPRRPVPSLETCWRCASHATRGALCAVLLEIG